MRTARVRVLRPRDQAGRDPKGLLPAELLLNVVLVSEPSDAEDEAPVEWMLVTSEPVSTAREALRVVDIYRTRWVIEDYFKALKTGCAYERRQLEGEHSLFNALALYAPIAAQILALRAANLRAPDAPADTILTCDQVAVLRHFCGSSRPGDFTVAQAMQGLARLGGHIKNNGKPGWQTLWRGFSLLELLKMGWAAARAGPEK